MARKLKNDPQDVCGFMDKNAAYNPVNQQEAFTFQFHSCLVPLRASAHLVKGELEWMKDKNDPFGRQLGVLESFIAIYRNDEANSMRRRAMNAQSDLKETGVSDQPGFYCPNCNIRKEWELVGNVGVRSTCRRCGENELFAHIDE